MKKLISIVATFAMALSSFSQSWNTGTNIIYTNPSTTNVGIGISTPDERLHINNGCLKIGYGTSTTERSKNVLRFGDEDYVQIGEWIQDDVLSFRAGGFTFGDGEVGIGVSNPLYTLDVGGTLFLRQAEAGASGSYSSILWNKSRLVMGARTGSNDPSVIELMPGGATGEQLYSEFIMYTKPNTGSCIAKIKFNTEGNSWLTNSGNVGIGTSNPSYKLDVNGTIRANEILVNQVPGADFVFAPSYNLRPLSEVLTFIQQNQHLPEIPSAAEMQKNGVNMTDLQIQLLQKVEELTLYIIQQDQRIHELESHLSK